MKKISVLVKAVACTVAMFTLVNVPVFASSNISTNTVKAASTVSRTISGTLNLTRYPSKEMYLGRVKLNSTSKIILNMPNNNRKDLMQGKIRLVKSPIITGSEKSYQFMNASKENWIIELSDISSGIYDVYFDPDVYGTSNKATFKYTIGGGRDDDTGSGSTTGSKYFTGKCNDPLELNVATTDIYKNYNEEPGPDDYEPNDTIAQAYPYASMPSLSGNKFCEGYKHAGNHEAGEPDFYKINLNSSVTYDVSLKNFHEEQHIYILQKNSDGTFTYWGQKNQVPGKPEYFTFVPPNSGEYYILITGGSKRQLHYFFAVERPGIIDPYYQP